ncbi:MAG: Fic family protein, partial [Thermoplasmata archaeon]
MVRVRSRSLDGRTYYYIEHSLRRNGKVKKVEKYIGKEEPGNLDALIREFQIEIYEDKWYSTLEKIKRNYKRLHKSMPKSVKEKDAEHFMVNFTYNTQRIEGSTLTLRETAVLLEKEFTPASRPLADVKEAESHKNVFYEMLGYDKDLALHTVLHWHKMLFGSTKADIAGKFRQHQVGISGSKFVPPMPVELAAELKDFFKWYNKSKKNMHPVELAALVHLKFVTIHPFADGNGRVGRILMNFILNKNRYPMLDIPYRNRNSYYNALERSQTKKDDSIFVQWLFRNYIKE